MSSLFGAKIKELRKLKGLTLEEVAQKVNSSKGYISGIEKGVRRPPSDEIIKKLSRVLGADRKSLIRLAHIEKIPEDIKQELLISKIITPRKIVEEMGSDLSNILKECKKSKKKEVENFPEGYVPVINCNDNSFPANFSDFQQVLKSTSEFMQFSISGIPVSFALRLPDTSMERKKGRTFNQGSLVFFARNKKIQSGDYVFIIYRTEQGFLSLFRYLKEYNRRKVHLVSLNTKYKKEIILSRRIVDSFWKAVAYLEIIE